MKGNEYEWVSSKRIDMEESFLWRIDMKEFFPQRIDRAREFFFKHLRLLSAVNDKWSWEKWYFEIAIEKETQRNKLEQ